MSIFIKTCPECAQPQPVAAIRCSCGYSFDSHAHGSSERLEIEMIAEEERLYQEYLEARAAQAARDLDTARTTQPGTPGDKNTATQVLRAEQALAVVNQELAEQSAKTQDAMNLARKARESQPRKPARPDVAESQLGAVRLQPVSTLAPARSATPAAPASAIPPVASIPPVALIDPKNNATKTLLPQKAPVVRRAKFAKPALNVPTVVPNEAFRATQAAKAEKALHQAKEAALAKARNKTEVSQTKEKARSAPGKQVQARLVPPLDIPDASLRSPAAIRSVTKECPNCTSTVAESANRCRCGYAFPSGECELPGLPLGAGELSILANGIKSDIGGRRN